jgi:eukaryotic translation initiation factor 2C
MNQAAVLLANKLQVHNITLENENMPVVNVGTRVNPSYLPADVCEVLPGQNCSAKLDSEQTAAMIKFAVRKPSANAASITHDGPGAVGLLPANVSLVSYSSLCLESYLWLENTDTIRANMV